MSSIVVVVVVVVVVVIVVVVVVVHFIATSVTNFISGLLSSIGQLGVCPICLCTWLQCSILGSALLFCASTLAW